jgi:anti-sigma factor RsiW
VGASSHRSGAHEERGRERAPERGAPEIPGSVLTRSGARSRILGACSHLRSLDAPARSALLGLGAGGGALPATMRGSNVCVQVLSNAILLEWVPTGVTRTSNKVRQSSILLNSHVSLRVVHPNRQFICLTAAPCCYL